MQLNPEPVITHDLQPPAGILSDQGNSNQPGHSSRNPAFTNHCNTVLFQTVQHSKIIRDPHAKPKGLLWGNLNICSVKAKTEQLQPLFTDSNLDFLCLSETWLTTPSPVASFTMPGYKVFRKDRNKGRGAGLLMYVKDDIKCKQIESDRITCSSNTKMYLIFSNKPVRISKYFNLLTGLSDMTLISRKLTNKRFTYRQEDTINHSME